MQRLVRLFDVATEYRHRLVIAALIAASCARLVYVTYLGDDIGGPDGPTYDQAGWDLATKGFMSSDVTGLPYWPPGYPLLVATHYLIAGHHPYAVKLSQVVVIALLTWLTFRLAERVGGPRVALVAGIGMSASLVWLALPHPLMYEPWLALLLVVALLALLRANEEGDLRFVLGAGIALGVAAGLQDKFLTLLPLLAVWLVIGSRFTGRSRALAPALLLLSSALVVIPLVARNTAVYGEPFVLGSNHGANVVIGNGPGATGGYVGDPTLPQNCLDENGETSGAEIDRSLLSCSVRYAIAHPGHTISLWPAKLARFWAPYVGPRFEIVNWRHFFDWRSALPGTIRTTSWFRALDVGLSAAWVVAGLALLIFGVIRLIPTLTAASVLLLIAILWLVALHLATFGDPRFRIPILPLVWIVQALALTRLLEHKVLHKARS